MGRMALTSTIEARIRSRALPGFPAGKTVIPDYGGYSICAVPGLIRSLFNGKEARGNHLQEAFIGICGRGTERVVLLIVDGVGYAHLCELLERFPDLYLHRLIKRGALVPVTSVFPTTTVSALTSFSTGRTPQEHGMVGYRLYLEEIDVVTNMVRLATLKDPTRDSAIEVGLDLQRLLSLPTLYEQLAALEVETHVILDRGIASSGLSQLLYRGATRIHPTVDLADLFVVARRLLSSESGKRFLTLYWGGIDAVAHTYGPYTEEFVAAFRALDGMLEREWRGRLAETLLIVASDHGFVTMDRGDYDQLSEEMSRRYLVRLPVGEPRASYLFVRDGEMSAMAELAAAQFDDSLICLDSREAISMGLLGRGEAKEEVARRIGDLLLVSTGRTGLFHPYPDATRLKGMHGGLTAQEMIVPLIVTRL